MIKRFIKGILIGIAKITPGISGSILAISLGIYSKCINILSKFYKMTKDELRYIFPIFMGVLIGALGFSVIIDSVYKKCYLATILLFTGFIIGDMHKEITVNLKKDIPFYIIGILAFLILPIFDIHGLNFKNQHLLFSVLGLIESFTMIIPGISGTAILMSLDLYDVYLDFMVSLINPEYWISHMGIISIYTMSMVVSGFLTIKLVALLYSKFKCFSSIIRTLMMIAIFVMVKKALLSITWYGDVILGITMLIIGILLSYLFNKMLSKKAGRI